MNVQRVGFRLGLAMVTGLVMLPPVSLRAQNIANGGASWNVGNSGNGFGIVDASYTPTGQGDAFDDALLLRLNNAPFFAPGYTAGGSTASSGAVSLAGLTVNMSYRALAGSPTLRTFITLTNASASAVGVTASWVSNVGSDGGTQVVATSSGDQTFTTADRYIVTDDGSTTAGDPTNSFVLFGAGAPAVTPSGVSQTVFSNAGTQGVRVDFALTIPGGATQSLLFFNQIHGTAAAALAAITAFNTPLAPTSDLLVGLTQSQLGTVVNFQVGAVSAVPEPSSLALLGLGAPVLAGVLSRRRRAATRA